VLCRPQGYSSLNASGIMTEDQRIVNPGMVHGGDEDWEQAQAQREEEEEEERRVGD
jgi:palmitoyltransferase ZDHHC9/14/18